MNTEINFGSALSALAPQTNTTNDQTVAQASKQVPPLLGGENVTVTSGATSNLEKLVAQLKNENENARADLARMRLSAITTALDMANVRLTNEQSKAFETLTEQGNIQKSLESELEQLRTTYGIGAGADASAVMEMKIKSLEQAVERAVQEGKDHNEAVRKAKEQLDRDQAELARLENAEVKDEAAIQTARNAATSSQSAYDAAVALASGDTKKIADAQSALAQAKSDSEKVTALQSGIADAAAKVSAALGVIGSIKIGEIAAALTAVADDTSAPEPPHTSAAEDRKEAAKAIANDPLVAISQSLDKIDEVMQRVIEENQVLKA